MSQKEDCQNNDVKYYYNRKSKYFEELKQDFVGRVSIQHFLTYLKVAYFQYDECEIDFYFETKTNWFKTTKIELFSELIDIDITTLYSVMNERKDVSNILLYKEHEIFSYGDYLFDVPSETNMTIFSNTSTDSNVSLADEPFEFGDYIVQGVIDEGNNELVSTSVGRNTVPKDHCKTSKKKNLNKNVNPQITNESKNDSEQGIDNSDRKKEIESLKFVKSKSVILNVDVDESFCNNEEYCKISSRAEDDKIIYKGNSVRIRVKDIVKKLTKDFYCPSDLLVSKMGYFANKSLKCADITIHCDLKVFNWVIDFISQNDFSKTIDKTSDIVSVTNNPLNPKNVVSFLSCVSFLQIEELTAMCLCYCKNNMNEILKTSKCFSRLDRKLLNRLGNMFTNVEVETIIDRKNQIQPYLYFKLLLSLCQTDPEPWKGHFSSLANIFRCGHCKRLVMHKIANKIPCLQNNVRMNVRGEISNVHNRESNWNLTDYIVNLKRELKSWRKVYWRIWAECHFLYCTSCKSYYSVYYYNKCMYHPDEPVFSRGILRPWGNYPCCGSKVYMYECFVRLGRGCRIKYHTPILKNNRSSSDIMKLVQRFQRLIFSGSYENSNIYYNQISENMHFSLISRNPEDVSLLLCDQKKEVLWRLPYYIPNQIEKGLVPQKIGSRKNKDKTTYLQPWSFKIDKSLNVLKRNSSFELCGSIYKNNPYRTLVSMLKDSDDSNCDLVTNLSSCTSNNSRDDDEVSQCSSNNTSTSSEHYDCGDTKWNERKQKETINTSLQRDLRYVVRINQDNQRECEERTFISINSILCSRKHKLNNFTCFSDKTTRYKRCTKSNSNVSLSDSSTMGTSRTDLSSKSSSLNSQARISHSRKTAIWNSHTPLSGTYTRIESEWKSMKKQLANVLKSKQCIYCQDLCNNRDLLHSMPKYSGAENKMCIFDNRSQELEYLAATYRPVKLRKEYKFDRYRFNVDWHNAIEVEQKWCTFLQLFSENDVFPNKESKNKLNMKPETISFES